MYAGRELGIEELAMAVFAFNFCFTGIGAYSVLMVHQFMHQFFGYYEYRKKQR